MDLTKEEQDDIKPLTHTNAFFEVGGKLEELKTPVYKLENLPGGWEFEGPLIILNSTSTILVEPGCSCLIDAEGSVQLTVNSEGTLRDR